MKINILIFSTLLLIVNIASAQWFTVTTSGLPQNLVVNQQYQNVKLTLTNTTASIVALTTTVTAVPKSFPSNSENSCESVTLAPKQSCVLASAASYTPSTAGTANWGADVIVVRNRTSYRKRVSHNIANGVDAAIVPLPKNSSVAQKIPVQINVENRGTTAAKGFVVDLPSLAGLTYNENTCSTISILDPAESCVISGEYTPPTGTTGDVSLKATVEYNEGDIIKLSTDTFVHSVAVQGSVSPKTDNVSIGQADSFAYTFRNTSTTTAAEDVSITLPTEPGLTTTANNCPDNGDLAANKSCTVQMSYIPPVGSQGLHTFTARLNYNGGNGVFVTHNSNISAIAVSGQVSRLSANVYIGGTDSFTYTFLNNSKTAAATGVSVVLPTDPELTVTNNTCRTTIAASTACTVTEAYSPTEGTQGQHQFTAVLRYNEGGDVVLAHTASVATVNVNGLVSPETANISIGSPDAFSYTFTNTSDAKATGISVNLPAETELTKVVDTCSTLTDGELPANQSCTIDYSYTPPINSAGQHNFTAVLSYNEGGDVVLTHKATVSTVNVNASVTPDSNVSIGQADLFTYTYTNTSDSNATGVSVIYTHEPDLTLISNGCSATLSANSTCSVELSYTPPEDAQGQHDFTAVFRYAEGGDLISKHSTNVSTVPVMGIITSPTNNVPVGTTDDFTYTFINTSATATASDIKITSPSTGNEGFSITDDNCTGYDITAGNLCTVTGQYTGPVSSEGQHSFTMILSYDEGADVILTHKTNITQPNEAAIYAGVTPTIKNIAIGGSYDITYTFFNAAGVGTNPAEISSLILPTAPGLVLKSNTCQATLAYQTSCTLTMTYTPPVGTPLGFEPPFTAILIYPGDGGPLPAIVSHYANITS